MVLPSGTLEKLYKTETGSPRRSQRRVPQTTLFDVLEPVARGEPTISDHIAPVSGRDNEFQFDLIPGHPLIALLEDRLSQSWLLLGSGDLGAARITNWNTQLLKTVELRYDYVFYDVGPSLGALNRTVLIGADSFLTPMGCDIFSMLGVSNISQWLTDWIKVYSDAIKKVAEQWDISDYALQTDPDQLIRFIGYTVQQYITKSKKGQRRPTVAFENIMERIPDAILNHLGSFIASSAAMRDMRLPDVPHMYSLVPLAQDAKVPIHRIESKHGLVGAQYSQRDAYIEFIRTLASAILRNSGAE